MSRKEIFDRLTRSSSTHQGQSEYTFQNGRRTPQDKSRSFQRTGRRTNTASRGMKPKPAKQGPAPRVFERDSSGDRPAAVVRRQDGVVYEYEQDSWRDIATDLFLRTAEVAFAAGALAIGEEIFYYFRQRRFRHRRGPDE